VSGRYRRNKFPDKGLLAQRVSASSRRRLWEEAGDGQLAVWSTMTRYIRSAGGNSGYDPPYTGLSDQPSSSSSSNGCGMRTAS